MAIAALIGVIWGAIEWHNRYALAADVGVIQIQQDLMAAKHHYYFMFDQAQRYPDNKKIADELKQAENDVERLKQLLDRLKSQ